MGFGFAGILRRFVAYFVKAVWSTALSAVALNRAMMTPESSKLKSVCRYVFFFICISLTFMYTWFPTFIFNALGTFNWMIRMSPGKWHLAAITGGVSGVETNPVASFYWNIIGKDGLMTPWFFARNSILWSCLGNLGCDWLLLYELYQNTEYIAILSNSLSTNKASKYEVENILSDNYEFDNGKYRQYFPPFYSAGDLVSCGCFIATYPFLIMDHRMFSDAFKQWFLAI